MSKQNASGVKASNWIDKRNVLTLSTIPEHTGELIATGKKSRSGNDILKPGSVLDSWTTIKQKKAWMCLTKCRLTALHFDAAQNGIGKLQLNCLQELQW